MLTELDDLFASDKTSEEDGVWVDVTPKIKFKIRAYSAKAVGDLREKLTKPFQTMIRAGVKIPDDQNEEIGLQVIAGAVLADWKGITAKQPGEPDADGAPTQVEVAVPYSADVAYDYLKRLTKLANFIIGISTDGQFFKADQLREEGAGN